MILLFWRPWKAAFEVQNGANSLTWKLSDCRSPKSPPKASGRQVRVMMQI